MDVSYLLDGLNDKQRDAVAAPPQHMLVLAGAGSGKTRVLVHRLAWLMQVERVAPYSLLAVTFTNKASQEMRGRIESTIGVSLNNLWMGYLPWFVTPYATRPLSGSRLTAGFSDYR